MLKFVGTLESAGSAYTKAMQPIPRWMYFFLAVALFAALFISMISEPPQQKLPSLEGAPYRNPSLPVAERVENALSLMTLEEKIGQMALVEKNSIHDMAHLARFGIGGILSGGGGKPEENTPEGWRAMITSFIEESRKSRTGIPILYGLDANHGHGNVPGATIFPHAIGIGAANNPELTQKIAHATGLEVRATGASWIYSPSLDLPTDIRWGRVYEAFSDDSARTGELGAAFVRGLLESDSIASVKHYLGVGSMGWKTSTNKNFSIDQGRTEADEELLRSVYLPPFQAAVDAGAQTVMVGLNSWRDTKLSASSYLITDILKNELGFTGFVVSDWYGVYEISESKYHSAVTAINAGVDMVMLPFEYELFISDVKRAVARGDISEERITDAARRILSVKFSEGLFDGTADPDLSVVGSEEHRALAREAVAQSLVLLKNDGALPLASGPLRIRVAGSAADNVGRQSGAWTVEWQGIDGNWLPNSTSILEALSSALPEATIAYDPLGYFPDSSAADVGIAIVGEKPYAEGWGDNALPILSEDDRKAIANLRAQSRTLVVVIVSGRPLFITHELPEIDALVAAWLPGQEGGGVADVLTGKKNFSGTLPLHWPKTLEQLPLSHRGSADGTSPLFPRGFGLTY